VITAAEAVAGKTIFARFAPSVKKHWLWSFEQLTGTGLNQKLAQGSSITAELLILLPIT
jgi:hypothetical protein